MDVESLLNKKVKAMKPSGIRKYFDIAETMENVISLGVGEPDFVTPWHIRDAGIRSLEKGHTRYTSNKGLIELRNEVKNFMQRKYNLSYSANDVLISVGGSDTSNVS